MPGLKLYWLFCAVLAFVTLTTFSVQYVNAKLARIPRTRMKRTSRRPTELTAVIATADVLSTPTPDLDSQIQTLQSNFSTLQANDPHYRHTQNITSNSSIFSTFDENGKPVLTYYGLMVAGAVARSVSATAIHPLNVMKTMLQTKGGKMPAFTWKVLSRGAGSQLIMSVPHGALNFVVTEVSI